MSKDIERIFSKYQNHPDFLGLPITDVNQPGAVDDRLLHIAARKGEVQDIEALIAAGAQVNLPGDLGNTPLHNAALTGSKPAVLKLLELGAKTDIKNEFGETAADVAANGGHTDLGAVISARR
ncbi:ankyrin repeat domain-containing protein [Ralstonia insidiosa]|uniref:Ankyrin repeat domain-containing protein n=1 Tax=Ralstonia insidiosa TaxID=190721 RepID=A0A848NZU5_9RALS|nr:ankyrin repeat domain-containing protein [Ralstonia insidiosa]NMV37954.1 ankyrin repeat domain-containing protein [Ralstonia insidiosa]